MRAAPSGRIGSRQVEIRPVGWLLSGDDVVWCSYDFRNVRPARNKERGAAYSFSALPWFADWLRIMLPGALFTMFDRSLSVWPAIRRYLTWTFRGLKS